MQTVSILRSRSATGCTDAVGDILMASVGDHYIAGDGRVNENFGLTSIHHVFHEEHNYQVDNLIDALHREDMSPATITHAKLHDFQIDTGRDERRRRLPLWRRPASPGIRTRCSRPPS